MPADAEDRIIPPGPQDGRGRPDFEPVRIQRRRPGAGLWLLLGLLVIGGGAGAWYMLDSGGDGASGGRMPVVRADVTPVKERPEQPGGMDIPNRDKEIYGQMDGSGEQPVERLLPEAEQPAPLPGAGVVSGEQKDPSLPDVPKAETVEELSPPPEPPPAPAAPEAPASASAPSAAPAQDGAAPEPVQEAAKPAETETPAPAPAAPEAAPEKPASASAPEAPAAPASAPEPSAGGKEPFHRVQIASVRSARGAETVFKQAQKQHADLFAAKALYVQRIDLGAPKGVYFRVRVGPYDSAAAAKQTCAVLKKRDGGCLTVPPGK